MMIMFLISLAEAVQMRGHNMCFYSELTKIIPTITKYSLLSRTLEIILEKLNNMCTKSKQHQY